MIKNQITTPLCSFYLSINIIAVGSEEATS